MCHNEECPQKLNCLRYVLIPSKYQSCFMGDYNYNNKSCDFFIDIHYGEYIKEEDSMDK